MFLLDITCPIYALTGVICPTCGMTRAIYALINLNFKNYIVFNAMTPFVFLAVILLMCINQFKYKRIVYVFSVGILLANLVYYFVRLSYF